MATSNAYGTGIIRTQSGHETYAPDGIVSSTYSSPNFPRPSDFSHTDTLQQRDEKDAEKDSSADTAAGNSSEDRDVEKQQPQKEDGEEEEKDPNVVDWDGEDDPENPMNWKPWRKWSIAIIFGLMTFVVTFASSVFSSATTVTATEFGVSQEVMILGVALFVLGFAFGPIVWVS